jgi:DNA-binding PadR family transcriptional regulator
MLRYVLLALLADSEPRHGYALMKAFAERSGVRLSIGNVYRELQRLLGEGLIVTAANPIGADPRRTPYTLTDAGRDALAAWFATPARALARGTPDALAYRLALLSDMDPAQADGFLDDLQTELWAQAKTIEAQRASRREPAEAGLPTRSFLQSRHARYLAADIELVDEMRTGLAEWRRSMGTRAERPAFDARNVRRVARIKPRSGQGEQS